MSEQGFTYWPGWQLRVDGKLFEKAPEVEKNGLILLHLPAGSHLAELRYNLSPEGKFARIFSSAAAGMWVVIIFVLMFTRWRTSSKLLPANKVDNSELSENEAGPLVYPQK